MSANALARLASRLVHLVLLTWAVSAVAQDAAAPESSPVLAREGPTIEHLESRRKVVESSAALGESQKSTALKLYDRALRAVRRAAELEGETERIRRRIEAAPARTAELRAALDAAERTFEVDPDRFADIDDERLVAMEEQARRDFEAVWKAYGERRVLLRRTVMLPMVSTRELDAELESAPEEGPARLRARAGVRDLVLVAREDWRAAQASLARAQRAIGRELLANLDVLVQLGFLELESALAEVNRLTARYEALAEAVHARRMSRARAETQDAEVTAVAMSQMPEAMRRTAEETLEFRREIERTLALEHEAARRLRAARSSVGALESGVEIARIWLAWVGPSRAVGRLIRNRLDGMPSLAELRQIAATRSDDRAWAVGRRVDLTRLLLALLQPESTARATLAEIPYHRRVTLEDEWVREEIFSLVVDQREGAEALYATLSRYLGVLTRLDDTEARIAAEVRKGEALAREDLLWIPDLSRVAVGDLGRMDDALGVVASREQWSAALLSALASFRARPVACAALLALFLGLLALRPRLRRALGERATQVGRVRTDAFRHTLAAAFHTVLLAVTWPLAFLLAGWLALSEPWSGAFSVAVGEALVTAGQLMILITLLRWAARPNGLARHFRWPEAVRAQLRDEPRWFAPVFVTAGAVVAFADEVAVQDVTVAIGRPMIMILWLSFAIFVWRTLGPRSALSAHLREVDPPPLAARWRLLWYPVTQGVPVVLVLATALGYHYATVQLSGVLARTLLLIVGLLLLRDVLLRWFYVAERRLRLEALLRQRDEARAERAERERGEEGDGESVDVEVEEVDYRQLGSQGRAVIQAGVLVGALLGLWTLWGDLLPAVGVLERVELPFTHLQIVDGIERRVPVNLSDVGLALVILVTVLFAARNLGGLLGFTVLQRLRLDAGANYAIVTLCQYVLIGGGLIYVLSALGLEWSKLQWLVAALGVGLGFGLQEIVANFVSGIILLLERPVRVGDIVTVGDADGTVARIRIRATTIITFERKELVVPNKEFITTRVLNWTLSDANVRLFVVIGIAYGSDSKLARKLVLEAANEAEHVLDDPPATVTFGSFGDNSLNLELRAFLPNFDHFHETRTAVHEAVYEKFADAGITIAFPQRDVHLDLTGPVGVQIQPTEASEASGPLPVKRGAG